MKKFVYASVLAMASLSLAAAPMLRAQDITIKDPAEFNAYQLATSQADPKAKAAQLESFLSTYPQSVVKTAVLDQLIDAYQQFDADKTISSAARMLQVDANNMKAIFASVYFKKIQCGKTQDATICDDGAALAKKGLMTAKPSTVADADWKSQTAAAFPVFHSMIALDAAIVKKDFKTTEAEYTQELMLLPEDQTKTVGLPDTLHLAEAYAQPGAAKDIVKSIWFYARAYDFAPANFKPVIEKSLNYYYKKFHGDLTGLDDIKTKAAATTFPDGVEIKAAKTPAEIVHDLIVNTPDLKVLALDDKETILAVGTKEDADKLWALVQGQQTPVPGVVIEATASVIKVAVSNDAKSSKTPDFIVNMKEPLADKDIPAAGTEYGLQPKAQLNGTYDTYTQIPATDTTAPSAQIVLKDAFIQAEIVKKAAPVAHKPAAAHKAAH